MMNYKVMKHVFLIITSGDCPICAKFKEFFPGLMVKLRELGRFSTIAVIEMTTRADVVELKNYHPDLSRAVGFVPMVMLLTSESWNNKQEDSKLQGIVMGGKLNQTTNQVIVDISNPPTFTIDTILEWTKTHIQNNPLFNTSNTSNTASTSNTSTSNTSTSNTSTYSASSNTSTSNTSTYNTSTYNTSNTSTTPTIKYTSSFRKRK